MPARQFSSGFTVQTVTLNPAIPGKIDMLRRSRQTRVARHANR
jgi:hypothetical protein